MSGPAFRIEALSANHDLSGFACDAGGPLDVFLKRYALTSAQAGSARTFVICTGDTVIGYYTLAPGSIEHEAAPQRLRKGLARHPIGIILLARLAVDAAWQGGKGVGPALLKDAVLRSLRAMSEIGGRALVVHAKDDKARQFYEYFNFVPFEGQPLHLYALEKDLRALLR